MDTIIALFVCNLSLNVDCNLCVCEDSEGEKQCGGGFVFVCDFSIVRGVCLGALVRVTDFTLLLL